MFRNNRSGSGPISTQFGLGSGLVRFVLTTQRSRPLTRSTHAAQQRRRRRQGGPPSYPRQGGETSLDDICACGEKITHFEDAAAHRNPTSD